MKETSHGHNRLTQTEYPQDTNAAALKREIVGNGRFRVCLLVPDDMKREAIVRTVWYEVGRRSLGNSGPFSPEAQTCNFFMGMAHPGRCLVMESSTSTLLCADRI